MTAKQNRDNKWLQIIANDLKWLQITTNSLESIYEPLQKTANDQK